jgi:hypothetical protein
MPQTERKKSNFSFLLVNLIFLAGCSGAAKEAARDRERLESRLAEVTADNQLYKTVDAQLAEARKSVKN